MGFAKPVENVNKKVDLKPFLDSLLVKILVIWNSPTMEAIKELLRWAMSYLIAQGMVQVAYLLTFVIADVLNGKMTFVSEYWCLSNTAASCIPLREYAVNILTLCNRALDKYVYEKKKEIDEENMKLGKPKEFTWSGLLPF